VACRAVSWMGAVAQGAAGVRRHGCHVKVWSSVGFRQSCCLSKWQHGSLAPTFNNMAEEF
jgi:hypothetical protein